MSRDGIIKATFGELLNSREERLPNDGTHPLYSLTIKDGVTPKTERYEREFLVTNKESKKYKVIRTGDLVFNPSNLRWGAIATSLIQFPVLASPIYEVFYPKDDQVLDPYFLGALASSPILMAKYLALVEGTLVERTALKKDDFLEIEIEIPPLPEQKKIAEILSGIDRCITKLKRRIQKQNLINESILSGMEDLRGNKIARHEATIGDIATKVGSGITPRGGSDTYESEGVTFIRSQNVLKMRLSLGDAVKIPQHIHASMSGTRVQPNDVLLNITGASIGRSAVVPDGTGEANVNQHVCIIRTKETCDPLFLCGWLNSESGQIAINSSQAGGNRQGLNFEQIRAMSIPLPPIHLQKQISVALQASNSLIQLMQGKLDWFLNTKNALSSDLLSGRKRVSI